MGNSPPGDMEVNVPADAESSNNEAIRVRLKRKKRTLEISRHSDKPSGGRNDNKKVVPLSHTLELPENDWRALDPLERRAMGYLADFLHICDAADAVESRNGSTSVDGCGDHHAQEAGSGHVGRAALDDRPRSQRLESVGVDSVSSSIIVQPRTRKF